MTDETAVQDQETDLAEEMESRQTKTKSSKKKAAKGKKTAGKKAAAKSKSGGVKKVGVIDTILEKICSENGATTKEILDALEKKFPDRKRDSMETTVRIQVTRLPKRLNFTLKKSKDEKRGLIYKAPASALKAAAKSKE